jgi:hypothetical protein
MSIVFGKNSMIAYYCISKTLFNLEEGKCFPTLI